MKIEEVVKTYGLNDYYEMPTGRIFKFSQASYNEEKDESYVPVNVDGDIVGNITIKGDIRKI